MALGNEQVVNWKSLKTAVDKLSDRLARKNGYYSTFTAGAAERLIVSDDVDSKFFTRQTGGNATVERGVALIDKMRGNSMVWNQLVQNGGQHTKTENGITCTRDGNGNITINGTCTEMVGFDLGASQHLTANHLYLLKGCPTSGGTGIYTLYTQSYGHDAGAGYIFTAETTADVWFIILVWGGAVANNAKFIPQLFDLTAMFGTTANAAAALGVSDFNSDQNKTAAINKFKELYPLSYYAYNAGSIVSFNGNTNCQIQSISRNLISNPDDILQASGWVKNADGSYQGNIASLYNRNLFGLTYTPNTRYTFSFNYEKIDGASNVFPKIDYTDGTYTTSIPTMGSGRATITSAVGKTVTKIGITYGVGSTYRLWDFQIEIGTTATAYEPYISSLCTLPAYTLRGIGTIKDEIEGNVLTRRIGVVDMGTLDWRWESDFQCFYTHTPPINIKDQFIALCARYQYVGAYPLMQDKTCGWIYGNAVFVKDSTYTDAAAFKTAMNGVYLLYELATPTTQTISEWDNSYDVYPNGNEILLPTNDILPHTTMFDGLIDYTIDAVEVIKNLDTNYVSTKQYQGLSEERKTNARTNIGVLSSTEVYSYHDSTKYDASNPSNYQTQTQVSASISAYHDTSKQDTLTFAELTDIQNYVNTLFD